MDKGIKGSGQGFDAASAGRLGSHGFIALHNSPEGRLRAVALQVKILSPSRRCAQGLGIMK